MIYRVVLFKALAFLILIDSDFFLQISFHGHKDAVKFFVHSHNLMLSGGQGYLDFRLDMDDQSKSMGDRSHLILWQLPN